jgi:hypothetical protein
LPEVERQQEKAAKLEVYEALEARVVKCAIPIPGNNSLERDVAELLPRPVGKPNQKPLVEYRGFLYEASSWKTARRVVIPQSGIQH